MAFNYTQDTYITVGEKESVEDVISLISPQDTPCYSAFRKTSCSQPVHSWQEDSLRAPISNAAKEGFDVLSVDTNNPSEAFRNQEQTVLRSNWTQIFYDTAQVSGTMEATELYGRANELDYQVMKAARQVRRDIEHAFVGTKQAGGAGTGGGSGTATARTLTGAQSQIAAGNVVDNGGVPAALAEADILAAHEAAWTAGGDPNWILCDGTKATEIAQFAYASGRQRDVQNESTLVNYVDLYQDPFGRLDVVIDRWVAADQVLLLETDRWHIPQLRPMESVALAKTGDNERRLVTCELTLAHENQSASALISELT